MSETFRLTIVSKRQITVPQKLLDLLQLAEGDGLAMTVDGNRILEVLPLKLVPTTLFTREVLKKLGQREAGKFVEVEDVSTIRKRAPKARGAAAGRST